MKLRNASIIAVSAVACSLAFAGEFNSSVGITHQRSAPGPIAILPTVNESPEKGQDLKDNENKAANTFLKEQFSQRSFTILSEDAVAAELKAEKIDLSDEDQRKNDILFTIGSNLHADYLVLSVITASNGGSGGFPAHTDGSVKLDFWLLDVKNHNVVIGAKSFSGSHRGGGFGVFSDKISGCKIKAVPDALKRALKDFLANFPKPH